MASLAIGRHVQGPDCALETTGEVLCWQRDYVNGVSPVANPVPSPTGLVSLKTDVGRYPTTNPTAIWRVPLDGQQPTSLREVSSFLVRAIAHDERCIYFATNRALARVDKNGGEVATFPWPGDDIAKIVVDDEAVYASSSLGERLYRIPK